MIDENRHGVFEGREFGVEPIRTVLLREAVVRVAAEHLLRREPAARGRHAELRPALRKLWEDNC